MNPDTTHPAEHIEVMGNAIARVLGRHLGVMLDDGEVDQVLEELDRQGYGLTTYGDSDPTTLDPIGPETIIETTAGNVTVIVHTNTTDDTTQARHAILNAREALTLELPK